jgi:hypothetical protein
MNQTMKYEHPNLMRGHFFYNADTGGGGGGTLVSGNAGGSEEARQHRAPNDTISGGGGSGWTWAKEDGALNDGWLDRLPGDLRGHASLKVIGSLPDLAKSYVETKSLVGKKLEMPGQGASPEQIAAWRKTVGAPERPEGYVGEAKSLRPEAIPENMWDVESERKFLAVAHKHHLPPAAVKDILGFYGDSLANGLKASQQQEEVILQAETMKLRQTWAQDFNANLSMASRVAQTVGLDPKTHPIFTSAEVVQAFARIGKLLSEDKLVKGDAQGINGSIQERIREMTDFASTSVLAREYRGEFGPERQAQAQGQYHQLLLAGSPG